MGSLTTSEISITFFALFLLLFSAYIFGKLFEVIKAPKVVGEIVGGMVVGGSVLALLLPNIFSNIFCAFDEEGKVLNIFYQFGLVFLMLSSGYNTTVEITKSNFKRYSILLVGATLTPMLLCIPFVSCFEEYFIGTADNSLSYLIVLREFRKKLEI